MNSILNNKINKNSYLFVYFPSTLVCLLPILLITGPFLPDLAVSICSILFLINSCQKFNYFKKYYANIFFVIFLIFWITIIIASLLSDYILYSLSTSLPYIRFGIFPLSVWFLLDTNEKIFKYFFYSIVFAFFILTVDAYFQLFTGSNILGWKQIEIARVSSFFKDELILGSYLSRMLPIFIAFWIVNNVSKKINLNISIVILIIGITSASLIFFSGERSAFFYLFFSYSIILALSKYKKIIVFISIISIISIISKYHPESLNRIVSQTVEQLIQTDPFLQEGKISANSTKKQFRINFFSVEHQYHYKSAFLMFQDNKLFGIGTKLFRKHCNEIKYKTSFESCNTHPHNTYVQLLAETGMAGFLVVVGIFCFLLYKLGRHFYLKLFLKKMLFSNFQICLLSAIAITLWPLIPGGNFFNNWLSVVYYLPIGPLLWSFNARSKYLKN